MSIAGQMDRCPFCREPILQGAKVCKHCHKDIPPKKKQWLKRLDTFKFGFLMGMIFTALLVILAYIHIYQSEIP